MRQDVGQLPVRAEQFIAALDKQRVNVEAALGRLEAITIDRHELRLGLLQTLYAQIRRVANDDVETLAQFEHPLRIEKRRSSVLIVRIPRGQFARHAG